MLRNPAHVTVTPPASVVETIHQSVLFAEKAEKRTLLASLLRERPESSVLVFSRTKHGADRIARILTKAGIEGRAIHGDKSQGARERAMNDFRSGACRVLIATDIAARGIDISELPLVINYDLPEVPETYVHRIGRTGRAGRDGQAIAFCSEEERPLLKDILKLTGLELDPDSGELAPAQNSRKKPAGKKPDTAQTGGQKQAEEKRAAQKQPAQSQAGQRPGRRKPQGQAPGDPKPQGQRTGGKQTPDGQQPQDKDAAARPARRRNRNRGGQKPDGQNAAAVNTGRGQDGRKPGSPKPARDKRETGSPDAGEKKVRHGQLAVRHPQAGPQVTTGQRARQPHHHQEMPERRPGISHFCTSQPTPCPGQPFENGHTTNPHRRQQTPRQPDGGTGKSGPAPKSLKNSNFPPSAGNIDWISPLNDYFCRT